MQKAYCYRRLWRKPITIHSLGGGSKSWTFPKGIEVRQVFVALLIFALLFMFRQQINSIIGGGWTLAFYLGIPWFLSGWLVKKNVQGKRFDRYLLGTMLFFYKRRFSYSSFKPV